MTAGAANVRDALLATVSPAAAAAVPFNMVRRVTVLIVFLSRQYIDMFDTVVGFCSALFVGPSTSAFAFGLVGGA